MGRVYLPADDIERFRCDPDLARAARTRSPSSSQHYVSVTEEFYERGLRLLPQLDRRSRACVAAMAMIYCQLLDRIAAGSRRRSCGQRVALTTKEKLWVAVRSLAGVKP